MGNRRNKEAVSELSAKEEVNETKIPLWLKYRIEGPVMCKCGRYEAELDGLCMRCKRSQ